MASINHVGFMARPEPYEVQGGVFWAKLELSSKKILTLTFDCRPLAFFSIAEENQAQRPRRVFFKYN